jgi:hypothetical protein
VRAVRKTLSLLTGLSLCTCLSPALLQAWSLRVGGGNTARTGRNNTPHRQPEATVVVVAVTLPVLLGMAALCVDASHIYNVRAQF